MKKLIISAVGKDQPGIVAAFTQVLYQHQCNLEDSSMTLLEDHFTMLFILHAPAHLTVTTLEEALKSVTQAFQLQLAIHPIETQEEPPKPMGRPWMLSVIGPDQTGIMFHVTQYLAAQGINIKQLSSKRLSRPAGTMLFLMALEVEVPDTLDDATLNEDLDQLAQQTRLEIHAEPLEVYTL